MKRIVLYLLLLAGLTGCTKVVSNQYQSFDKEIWNYQDIRTFRVDIAEAAEYDVFVLVRQSEDYGYNNLWMLFSMQKEGSKAEEGRYNFQLADITGRWLGRGPGRVHDHQFLVKSRQKLSPGTYTFRLQHDMRVDNLPGIAQVGVLVVKRR